MSSRIGLAAGLVGSVAPGVGVLTGVLGSPEGVLPVFVGSSGEREGTCGIGTTAGSFGGLMVLEGRPVRELPVLPAPNPPPGLLAPGVVVGGGVFSLEGAVGVVGAGAGTCAMSTCVGGLAGFWLSAA